MHWSMEGDEMMNLTTPAWTHEELVHELCKLEDAVNIIIVGDLGQSKNAMGS